jgi:hypothetical protein
MVPPNHISLLIANGRRAKEWRMGLRREGFDAQSIETSGSDAAKGDFWLVVPEEQRFAAQRFVSDVLAGKRSLPASAPVSGPLLWGAGVIVAAMLAFVLAAIFS